MVYAQKESYIRRTFALALKGFRTSGKNPCVGAILVYKERVIGEGYYQIYGGKHAEVNCVNSVSEKDISLIAKSTLFVSLEPCSIFGKTPPCANFIVKHNIPKVVISCLDPNPEIEGNGVKILKENDIEVEVGILEKEGKHLIHKFRVNILQERPFIALKWAQSKEGFSGKTDQSVWYTNQYAKIFAHKLRSQFESIMIGSNTVNLDNPSLNNRLFTRDSAEFQPIKIVIDRNESCHKHSKLFHCGEKCVIYTLKNTYKNPNEETCVIIFIDVEVDFWKFIFDDLFKKGISSVLVEGGPTIQKSIIKSNLWDESHILSSNSLQSSGIRSPHVTGRIIKRLIIGDNSYLQIIPE